MTLKTTKEDRKWAELEYLDYGMLIGHVGDIIHDANLAAEYKQQLDEATIDFAQQTKKENALVREKVALEQKVVAQQARIADLKSHLACMCSVVSDIPEFTEGFNEACRSLHNADDLTAYTEQIKAEARREALEEAANEVDSLAERPFDNEPEFSAMIRAAIEIRALKDKST